MAASTRSALVIAACLLVGCGSGSSADDADAAAIDSGAGVDAVADATTAADTDGDGISDGDEGAGDTDGDGRPDAADSDADGDGHADADEAGDTDLSTPPTDSDGDGEPDFQDLDSDDNGLPDAFESLDRDTDNDGLLDARDPDDDNDGLGDAIELLGGELVDTDGDGSPDMTDLDADGDGLDDAVEGAGDGDGDGIPNFREVDSDGDFLLDGFEGTGDADADGVANFLDLDSDSDGLLDTAEAATGTDPTIQDTDGDGFSDLVEQAILDDCRADPGSCGGFPDPLDPAIGVAASDFVFVMTLTAPPESRLLVGATRALAADLQFNVDTTSSMGAEIDNFRASLATIAAQAAAQFPDVAFGVSRFEDFPLDPYGSVASGDVPFQLVQRVTTDLLEAQTALNALSVRNGGDVPKSGIEALFQVASGVGLGAFVPPFSPSAGFDPAKHGAIGGAGFRDGAVPLIVHVTDALAHTIEGSPETRTCVNGIPVELLYGQGANPSIFGLHGESETEAALTAIGARVVSVVSDEQPVGTACSPRPQLEDLAMQTGAVVPPDAFTDPATGLRPAGCSINQCCTAVAGTGHLALGGLCPLVFDVNADGSGALADQVIAAIRLVATAVPLDVSVALESELATTAFGDLIDPLSFVTSVAAATLSPIPPGGVVIGPGQTFLDVPPGTDAIYEVTVENAFVLEADRPQVFKVVLRYVGDGAYVLDQRRLIVIVPAAIVPL